MNRYFLGLILTVLLLSNSTAQILSNFTGTQIEVPNQSPALLDQRITQAFQNVLIKMSGHTNIINNATMQKAKAADYLKSYRYVDQTDDQGRRHLYLQVGFNGDALKNLFNQAGQKIWPPDRPLILIWVQMMKDDGNTVISSGDDDPILSEVENISALRGVPIVFPIMDLQDQRFINTDKQEFNLEKLKLVAERYGVTSILAGNISHSHNQWKAQWLYLNEKKSYTWQNQDDLLKTLFAQSIDKLINHIRDELMAENATEQRSVDFARLQIFGIKELNDYVTVIRTLRHIQFISKLKVENIENNGIRVDISLSRRLTDLQQILQNDGRFRLISQTSPAPAQQKSVEELDYVWSSTPHPSLEKEKNILKTRRKKDTSHSATENDIDDEDEMQQPDDQDINNDEDQQYDPNAPDYDPYARRAQRDR